MAHVVQGNGKISYVDYCRGKATKRSQMCLKGVTDQMKYESIKKYKKILCRSCMRKGNTK